MQKPQITFTNKLLNFGDYLKYSKTFIETGTCHGRTVQVALDLGYESIRTVEVYREFYYNCVERFKGNKKVCVYLGKSTENLQDMLEAAGGQCVIFLDAHPAGPNTGGHDDLVEKGDKSEFHQDSILRAELEIILSHRKDHVIIIDDQNGLNPISQAHINQIFAANPAYKFYFHDEGAGEHFYKNKSVVCIVE
jgi:hypothetical protein